MLRPFLVALVFLGAGVAFAQVAPTHAGCATAETFAPLAEYIVYGTPTGGPTPDSVECVYSGQSYVIYASTVIAAVATSGTAWEDGLLNGLGGSCSSFGGPLERAVVACSEPSGPYTESWLYFVIYRGGNGWQACDFRHAGGSGGGYFDHPSQGDSCSEPMGQVSSSIASVSRFDEAFDNAEPLHFRSPFLGRWAVVLATGEFMECDEWGYCGDNSGGDGGDGGNPAGPEDPDTRCGILDIPCNFRKLFLPQENWGEKFGAVSSWGSARFPFGLVAWFRQENCAQMYFGCGSGEYFLAIPVVGEFVIGDREIEVGGFTVFAAHEDALGQVPEAVRSMSAWWISEPFGGRRLLFYGFVTSFYVGIFRRFVG